MTWYGNTQNNQAQLSIEKTKLPFTDVYLFLILSYKNILSCIVFQSKIYVNFGYITFTPT